MKVLAHHQCYFDPTPAMWHSPGCADACRLTLHQYNCCLSKAACQHKFDILWLDRPCISLSLTRTPSQGKAHDIVRTPSPCFLKSTKKYTYRHKARFSLQEHLAPLGSISKQAQGMISNASSLATSLLKSVLGDFRYILLAASVSSTSHLYTTRIILMSTHTCCWSLKFRR